MASNGSTPVLPRSPISDEDYATLKSIVASDPTFQDWLNRLEKSGTVTPEQLADLRAKHNDAIKKAKGLLEAFATLHK